MAFSYRNSVCSWAIWLVVMLPELEAKLRGCHRKNTRTLAAMIARVTYGRRVVGLLSRRGITGRDSSGARIRHRMWRQPAGNVTAPA
jgi:hypothetical protein